MTDELKDPKEPSIAGLIKAAQGQPLVVTPLGFQKAEQLLEKWPGSDGVDDHGRGEGSGEGEPSGSKDYATMSTEQLAAVPLKDLKDRKEALRKPDRSMFAPAELKEFDAVSGELARRSASSTKRQFTQLGQMQRQKRK